MKPNDKNKKRCPWWLAGHNYAQARYFGGRIKVDLINATRAVLKVQTFDVRKPLPSDALGPWASRHGN